MKTEIAILKATVKELDAQREVLANAIAVLSGKDETKTRKAKRRGRPKGSRNKAYSEVVEIPIAKLPKGPKLPKVSKPETPDGDLPTLPMKRGKGSGFDASAT